MSQTSRVLAWLCGVVLVLAIAATLIVSFTAHSSRRKLEDYKKSLEQRGEKFEIASLAPPPPPEQGNGAKELIAICQNLKEAIDKEKISRLVYGLEAKEAGHRILNHEQPEASARERRSNREIALEWTTAASSYEPVFALWPALQAAAQSPTLEIHQDYSRTFSVASPGMSELLMTAQYLSAMTLIFLNQNDLDSATAAILVQLKLIEMLQKQPTVISYLVAASIAGLAELSTWELLQHKAVSAAQLEQLQTAWQQVHLTNCLAPALRMERAWAVAAYSQPTRIFPILSGSRSRIATEFHAILTNIWKILFGPADERRLIFFYQELIDSAMQAEKTNSWKDVMRIGSQLQAEAKNGHSLLIFSKLAFPPTANSIRMLVGSQALASLYVAAIAAKRYQLDHGSPPESLQALVPDYLPEVPTDPMDGKPLRYSRSGRHFLLYSIGTDGKDDGGNPARTAKKRSLLEGKDIVWPKPAKMEPEPAVP